MEFIAVTFPATRALCNKNEQIFIQLSSFHVGFPGLGVTCSVRSKRSASMSKIPDSLQPPRRVVASSTQFPASRTSAV